MTTAAIAHLAGPARRAGLAAALGLCCSLLAGCATPPAHPAVAGAPAVAVPAAWSAGPPASAEATSLTRWWTRFQDPTLTTLVDQALASGTDVQRAQAALRQANALRDASEAALWPTLRLSASAQHSTSGGDSNGTPLAVGLGAAWSPDLSGLRRSALNASEANALASAATLGDVQRALAASVAQNYIALRSTQQRLDIAEDNLASQRETLQITQWREQAGLVTSLESEQARGAANQTAALLPTLQTSVDQSQHALAVLTGQPPAALASTLTTRAPLPQAADDLALGIPAQALRQRPDVQAAELQVQAAWARVDQARAAAAPDLSLSGSLGLSALSLGALTNGASVVSALMASVAMPLFDGGAISANVRAQQAAAEQARAAWQATVLAALKDVEDVLAALQGDRQRITLLAQAADAASNASGLARQRYGSGLVDFQTVLETQRTLLATQSAVASARADQSADQVRLYAALGGGWQADNRATARATPAASASPRSANNTPASTTSP
ncbi:MAG: efflux transporter outer membrane subunit [Ramlibacter sp.]|nr:efflux transporter outer membrane subunit [Ramlibacter sp.]